MSTPPQQEHGPRGAVPATARPAVPAADEARPAGGSHPHGGVPAYHADHPGGGAAQPPPRVYVPAPAPAPAYDEYADPAAAHGWQDAYDATRPLPQVTPEAADAPVPAAPRGHGGGRRGTRRKPAARRPKGVAVATGVLGAASAALIAAVLVGGPEGSGGPGVPGRPGGGTGTADDRTDPAGPDPEASGAPAGDAPGAVASGPPPPAVSASDGGEEEGDAGASPSATGGTASAAVSTAPASPSPDATPTGRGNGKPGKGGGRGPK